MAYANTVDEKSSGGITYPAGYLDASGSIYGMVGSLAEGYAHKAYGALYKGYPVDVDTYSLGTLSPGNYTIHVQGETWDWSSTTNYPGYVSPSNITLRNSSGTMSVFGSSSFTVKSPDTYYVTIEGAGWSGSQYSLYYTYDNALINYPADNFLTIVGSLTTGSTAYATGTYSDVNGTSLANPTYQWYSSTNGSTWSEIAGATDYFYTLRDIDAGKYIKFRLAFFDDEQNYETLYVQSDVQVMSSDSVAPSVTAFSPADEATGIAINSNIVLSFNEAIARGTGNIVIKNASGTVIATYDAATSSNLSISGSNLIINPTADLAFNTSYKVELYFGSIKDIAGNSYAGTTNYNFTTLADPANLILMGTSGNDVLSGGSGNDTINGGGGTDTAVYIGNRSGYTISIDRATHMATISDSNIGRDGSDTLESIEKIQFRDHTFDLYNSARTEAPMFNTNGTFLFDAAYYLLSHPELAGSLALDSADDHYLSTGATLGYNPNNWFDPAYYENRWADLKAANLDDATLFLHFNLYGVWEGRSAGPIFDHYDGARYLRDNPDVAAYVDANVADFLGSRTNGAIAHYVIYGSNEGRIAFDTMGSEIDSTVLIGIAP